MSAPAVVIRIDFEAKRPRVVSDYRHDGDGARMHDWLRSHPDLLELITRAIELQRQERAA